VDRQPYPLSRSLNSGQTIEIITAPSARPNAAWLNFVVTSRARTKIRQFLKNLRSEESIVLGRRLLGHALGGKRLEEIAPDNIKKVLLDTKHETLDGLLADIGLGNAMSVVIARRLLGNVEELNLEHTLPQHVRKLPIKGADGMLVTFANCCRPIPGDPIIAHISPGKGLVIHLESCRNIRGYSKEPDKYLPVQWDPEVTGDHEFRTGIQIEVINHQGVLAQLANTIAATGANIQGISTEEQTTVTTTTTITSPDGQTTLIKHELIIRGRVYVRGQSAVAYVGGNKFRLQSGEVYWNDRRIGSYDRQGHGEINHKPIRLYKPPHLGHFVFRLHRRADGGDRGQNEGNQQARHDILRSVVARCCRALLPLR